jgi:DNA-binding NarL/FixJ family response regulator
MKSKQAVSVFIIDDHPVVVEGLRSLLSQISQVQVVGTATNAFDGVAQLKLQSADVLLLDINLPDINGIDLCKKLSAEFPLMKILGISTFSERSYISRMVENGASGYLLKSASPEEIAGAIQTVLEGKLYLCVEVERSMQQRAAMPQGDLPILTKREKEVLRLIADGLTNGQIAAQLFISPLTVDSHRKNLLTKFQVNNTAALVRAAMERQLL